MLKKVGLIIIVVAVLALAVFLLLPQNDQDPNTNDASLFIVRGTVTAVEQGKDGVQVALETDEAVYSVTISMLKAEIIGRFAQIVPGAEVEVAGTLIEGMEPALITAGRVKVLGDDPEYVTNMAATVTQIETGKDGFTAAVETQDGTSYQVVISMVTTEIIYIQSDGQIQEGSLLLVDGELLYLDEIHIKADKVVVDPVSFGQPE